MASLDSDSMVLDDASFWHDGNFSSFLNDMRPLEEGNLLDWPQNQPGHVQHDVPTCFEAPQAHCGLWGDGEPSTFAADVPIGDFSEQAASFQSQPALEQFNSGLYLEANPNLQQDVAEQTTLSNSTQSSPVTKRQRTKIAGKQRGILEAWISSHESPYPNRDEKVSLSRLTGLLFEQISGWFTRARQRKLKRVSVPPVKIGYSNDNPKVAKHFSSIQSLPLEIGLSVKQYPRLIRKHRSQPLAFDLTSIRWQMRALRRSQASINPRLSDDAEDSDHSGLGLDTSRESKYKTLQTIDFSFQTTIEDERQRKTRFIRQWLEGIPFAEPVMPSRLLDISHHVKSDRREKPSLSLRSGSIDLPGQGLSAEQSMDLAPHRLWEEPKPVDEPLQSSPNKRRSRRMTRLSGAARSKLPKLAESHHQDDLSIHSGSYGAPSSSSANISSHSASSYVSFGPRRGRKGVFIDGDDEMLLKRKKAPSPSHSVAKKARNWSLPSRLSSASGSISDSEDLLLDTAANKRLGLENKGVKKTPSRLSSWIDIVSRSTTGLSYYCTFCSARFKSTFTWKRHEESTHAPRRIWKCAPPADVSGEQCPLCYSGAAFDGWMVWDDCPHGFSSCWQKAEQDRCFYRADALKQHIYGVHCKSDAEIFPSVIDFETWATDVDQSNYCDDFQCHFCGYLPENWVERSRHIARHFRCGMTMDMWQPHGLHIGARSDHGIDFHDSYIVALFSELSMFQANIYPDSLGFPTEISAETETDLIKLVALMGLDYKQLDGQGPAVVRRKPKIS